MVRRILKPEQIIGKLREVEVLLGQRFSVGEITRNLIDGYQGKELRP